MPKKSKEQESTTKGLDAKLLENKILVWKNFGELTEKGYGKELGSRLELAFTEALYLLEKGKINVKKDKTRFDFKKLLEFG